MGNYANVILYYGGLSMTRQTQAVHALEDMIYVKMLVRNVVKTFNEVLVRNVVMTFNDEVVSTYLCSAE